jgi:hypothetical protein
MSKGMGTVGCRVKSGRAIAVILGGRPSAPRALARRELVLCDPHIPRTKQPYHAGMGQAQTDQREIDRLIDVIARCADRAVVELLASLSIRSACLVVGSLVDPATIGNQHMRAHACEGRLFRTVLEDAFRAHGVVCATMVEKQLASEAAGIGISLADRARTIEAFGEVLGRPWTVDEKAAALGAWIAMRR